MGTSELITRERRGHLFLIGVNRPAKRNAFTAEMLEELARAFLEYEEDDDLRCAVVFAHGDHFTAGLDLADVGPRMMNGTLDLGAGVDPWGLRGRVRTKPTVMAIQGLCLTLGIELALAQDVRIAAADARFGQIEVKRGIFPFGGATFRLVAAAGWGNAMRYLLTGDEFGAEEALRLGLVQEVVPVGAQLERALAIGETVAAQAPLGVRATLASAHRWARVAEAGAAETLDAEIRALMQTEDAREGFMSFVERRPARFTGK